MKSFAALAFAASLALTSAQATYNTTTGTFICAKPDAAYCAGDSLGTNIIIRCNGYIGYPGNCNDNLDGEFPVGLSYAPCYQTSADSGDAACSKNCIIYGESGNYHGASTVVPDCIPQPTSISSTSSISSISRISNTSSTLSTSITSGTLITSSASITSNSTKITPIIPTFTSKRTASKIPVTTIRHSNSSTSTSTSPSHWIHPTSYHHQTLITLTTAPASSPSGSPPTPNHNGTTITSSGSPTNIPIGPTTTNVGPVVFKGAAAANKAFAGLAVVGMVFAALL